MNKEALELKKEEANIRKIARKRIAEIKELLACEKPRVLDLGSNWGFYLDEYRKKGWDAWGIEAEKCYPQDKQVINKKLELFTTFFNELPSNFDVVTAYCVLEHLTLKSFYKLLLNISRRLKVGGLFSVKVPYCKGWAGRFAPQKYYLDPNHKQELYNLPGLLKQWEFKEFRLEKTVIEGIHPERVFPRFGKTKLAHWLTEKLGMGDARVWHFRKIK